MSKPKFDYQNTEDDPCTLGPKLDFAIKNPSYGGFQRWATDAAATVDPQSLMALSGTILAVLPPQQREQVCYAVLADLGVGLANTGAGQPATALLGYVDQAEHWVEWAGNIETEAYAWVCFWAMQPERRKAFLDQVDARLSA